MSLKSLFRGIKRKITLGSVVHAVEAIAPPGVSSALKKGEDIYNKAKRRYQELEKAGYTPAQIAAQDVRNVENAADAYFTAAQPGSANTLFIVGGVLLLIILLAKK